jgi:phosphoribosylformylglycinamidine synthase subunit PurL
MASAILPTPAVGGVGLIADYDQAMTLAFKAEGESDLAGRRRPRGISASRSGCAKCQGREDGPPPPVDLAGKKAGRFRPPADRKRARVVRARSERWRAWRRRRRHGAGVRALASISNRAATCAPAAWLFGEDQGRYLLACGDEEAELIYEEAIHAGVPVEPVGVVGGCEIAYGDDAIDLKELRAAHDGWLPAYMGAAA